MYYRWLVSLLSFSHDWLIACSTRKSAWSSHPPYANTHPNQSERVQIAPVNIAIPGVKGRDLCMGLNAGVTLPGGNQWLGLIGAACERVHWLWCHCPWQYKRYFKGESSTVAQVNNHELRLRMHVVIVMRIFQQIIVELSLCQSLQCHRPFEIVNSKRLCMLEWVRLS